MVVVHGVTIGMEIERGRDREHVADPEADRDLEGIGIMAMTEGTEETDIMMVIVAVTVEGGDMTIDLYSNFCPFPS